MRKSFPLLVLLTALVSMRSRAADTPVPPPSETPAHVLVSGRTSTLVDVKVVAVGQSIPKTYSGNHIKNTAGFTWYVSQHYAFKTDYNEERARFYLTLLEMAYPHYVELFGKDPPEISDTRMAVVYGSSKEQLGKAMLSDGIKWDFQGGGITYPFCHCAYQYPSGGLQYHQRYILIHECTHLFQFCLTGSGAPVWFTEGVADALSSHVYDLKNNQLTVNVADKPTDHNWFDGPIDLVRRGELTAEGAINTRSRENNFLLVQYFTSDPGRLEKFRLFRDELFYNNTEGKPPETWSRVVLQDLFGPFSEINAGLKTWAGSHWDSFHCVSWGWEQDRDTLWSYGFAEKGKLSETDVFLLLNEKPSYDPLRMDYPLDPPPDWLGPVERGSAEPRVAALIDFTRNPKKGRAGIGLGVIHEPPEKAGMLKVLIDAEHEVVLDGAEFGAQTVRVPIPDNVIAAGANSHCYALAVQLTSAGLDVFVRAKGAGKVEEFKTSLALTAEQRERILTLPLAILARDGYHGVTPYFDDRRKAEPDLKTPAPPNRWRNPGDHALAALFKAAWKLAAKTPASLTKMKETLTRAADKDSKTQNEAFANYRAELDAIVKDIQGTDAEQKLKDELAAELKRAL